MTETELKTFVPKMLDSSKPQKVSYCIDLWQRDEQTKLAIKAVPGRITPVSELRSEPIAVVCFGPSLNDTWEQIRDYKYVISCSGSHKFLVERGIIPSWHVEVDPRAHKVQLIGPPQQETEYLIASACHPKVFEHLSGHKVKLWHVFSNEAESLRVLPRGEWAVMGGSSVGLRALTMARFLGFTDLHVFGMDGSEGATGKHAAAHPSQPKGYSLTEYDGIQYKTTASMLQCAIETWHELDTMPDVKATFYGEGLVQSMSKKYVRKEVKKGTAMIAYNKPELISAEYRRLNAQLHADNIAYGVGGDKHADVIRKLAKSLNTTMILDYGCGKGRLSKAIPWAIAEYDPAIPGKDEQPKPADLVACCDVLEHVEPEKLLFVLDDLRRCVLKIGYFVIHTGPSSKTLADGRNSHLIQQGADWWRMKLKHFFTLANNSFMEKKPLLYVVVGPKQPKEKAA